MRDRALRLREEGATVREIADTLGLPRATVGGYVAGVDPLPHALLPDDPDPDDPDAARLARLCRPCSRCGQVKPWGEFWAKAKWPDGTMRRPQSWCKECVKAYRRELRREDPETVRARDRHDWQRIVADPARHARRRETQRQNSTVWRRRHAHAAGGVAAA